LFVAEKDVKLDCDFESSYICGFTSDVFGSQLTWVIASGAMGNEVTGPDTDCHNTTTGQNCKIYMKLCDDNS